MDAAGHRGNSPLVLKRVADFYEYLLEVFVEIGSKVAVLNEDLFEVFIEDLSAPERSEGADVFKKHIRNADDHVGA